ncbi:hypothetical protein AB0E69_41030, partial [Kribbella sp. NPDC026611]|uniref:hypothetical protein n=1 Tax=Kribbella sp. NPDC026611 TaxID=3154911 RepID=UPI003411EA51
GVRPIFENSTACRKSMPKDALTLSAGVERSYLGPRVFDARVWVVVCLWVDSFEIITDNMPVMVLFLIRRINTCC